MALDMAGKGDFGGFVDKYAFLRPCKIPMCSLKYFLLKRHKKKFFFLNLCYVSFSSQECGILQLKKKIQKI